MQIYKDVVKGIEPHGYSNEDLEEYAKHSEGVAKIVAQGLIPDIPHEW